MSRPKFDAIDFRVSRGLSRRRQNVRATTCLIWNRSIAAPSSLLVICAMAFSAKCALWALQCTVPNHAPNSDAQWHKSFQADRTRAPRPLPRLPAHAQDIPFHTDIQYAHCVLEEFGNVSGELV